MTRAITKSQARMTRAAAKEQARDKARRARAAQRLQACAAVFVRSRIHFDARLGVPPFAAADRVRAAPAEMHDVDGGAGVRAPARQAPQVTFH